MPDNFSENLNSRKYSKAINWLLRTCQTSNLFGKYKIYRWLQKNHTGKLIEYTIANQSFLVPVEEWCFWLEKGPENYYLDEFKPFCDEIKRYNQTFTFFDLGADIGTVSSLVKNACDNIKTIVAFEPNKSSFQLLKHNLYHLGIHYSAQNKAVSNFNGYAAFKSDNTSTIDHEGSINSELHGETEVVSLDDWQSHNEVKLEPGVVLKIDVEGQERAAIEGARKIIKEAEQVIMLLEFHPDVLKSRTETPEILMQTANEIRAFKWYVPLDNNREINNQQSFYDQYPIRQYDVIGVAE